MPQLTAVRCALRVCKLLALATRYTEMGCQCYVCEESVGPPPFHRGMCRGCLDCMLLTFRSVHERSDEKDMGALLVLAYHYPVLARYKLCQAWLSGLHEQGCLFIKLVQTGKKEA